MTEADNRFYREKEPTMTGNLNYQTVTPGAPDTDRRVPVYFRDKAELQDLQLALADLLCWCRGYRAGQSDSSCHPIGVEELRHLHILLKDALE